MKLNRSRENESELYCIVNSVLSAVHHCMSSEFHDDFSSDTTQHRGLGNQTTLN